jgi:hypothetical protein
MDNIPHSQRSARRGWAGWPLLAVLVAHWALALGFNYVTPVFEGPDEPNHFLFIRYLQIYHQLPVQGDVLKAVRAHHPPAYFALGALLLAWSPPGASADWASLGFQENPRYLFRLDDPEPVNKSVFIHGRPDEQFPYAGQPLAVHVARLLSLAFSSLAVALTYYAALSMFPGNRPLAALAAGLVGFDPMVAYMGAIVQNDTATLASGAALVLLLGWTLRRPFRLRDWVIIGVVTGVGILLKSGLLGMCAVIGAAGALAAWRASTAWRQRLRALVLAGLGVAVPIALIDGWWFARNQVLYGDWTANASIVVLSHGFTPADSRSFFGVALYYLASGALGRFGNGGTIDFPLWAYASAGLLALAALAGLARLWWTRRRTDGAGPDWSYWALHALTIVVIVLSVLYFSVILNAGATGKYNFPAFPSFAVLLAAGALAWFRPRWRGWAAAGVLLLMAAASVYAMVALLRPSYGPPPQPSQAELDAATPLEADLGGATRLLGYHLDQASVKPGDTLKVQVYWLPEATTAALETVFIQVLVPGAGVVAQNDVYPGEGAYPTTYWTPGRRFVDTYYLHIPADAPAATGSIIFGLYDEASGQRLAATGGDADPGGNNFIQLGTVKIEP